MPGLKSDQVNTQGHKRFFRQPGGAAPNNSPLYAGREDEYMVIDAASPALSGGVDPIYVPSSRRTKQFDIAGRSVSPPDIASFTVMWREKRGRIPLALQDLSCRSAFYEVTGSCKSPDDINRGWTDYIQIYSDAEPAGNPDLGSRGSWDSDDPIENSLEWVAGDIYAAGTMYFGDNAAAQIDREVVAVVYGSLLNCGECGPEDNGSRKIYAVTKSSGGGSPGLPAELIYTLDGGGAWSEATITGIGATEDPLAIAVVGQMVLVLGTDAYYYAELNSETGAPGTFTKVTSGFLAANSPNDMHALSPSEIFFVGDGGYIYKVSTVGGGANVVNAGNATTANLARLQSDGDKTLVAVGASGAIIRSRDRGVTWSTTTTTPAANANQAVEVIGERNYWVGDGSGGFYYTINGGESWVTVSLPGTPTSIRDVVFATPEVGYVAYDSAGPAGNLAWTITGGNSWVTGLARVANLPVVDRYNRIAVPEDVHPTTAANHVALAALAANGTDGALVRGSANF